MKAVLWALLCSCITNATGLRECCQVITTNEICNNTCVEVLSEVTANSLATLSASEIQALNSACSQSYSNFWSCINSDPTSIQRNTSEVLTEGTSSTPWSTPQYVFCCNLSENSDCRRTCLDELSQNLALAASVGVISDACGPPLEDPIWNCLLADPTTATPTSGINPPIITQPEYADWARLQCCYRAKDDICKDACLDLYTRKVSSSSFFTVQLDCIHRPHENSMSTCLADVSSPCHLGCSGMQFCRNFNNRPFQFFRQCTTSADRLAKNSYYSWIQNGLINHPLVKVLVSNVEECLPEAWKAVACITHLQPCHSTTHATQICRVDCVRLLKQCTNSSAIATSICDILAPADSERHCISLQQFLQPSEYGDDIISRIENVISNPCDPNPCAEGYFCGINRNCDNEGQDLACTLYECRPGCLVGARPGIVLPKTSDVRVSLLSRPEYRCYGYINCSSITEYFLSGAGSSNTIRPHSGPSLISSTWCERSRSCVSHNGSIYEHLSNFFLNCNFCTCYYGRITCTNHSCISNDSYTGCECSREYAPVCTIDGITVINKCQANCFGYSIGEYHNGDCGSVNSCSTLGNICGPGSRCIPKRHSCLSNSNVQCPQYECVSLEQGACSSQSTPVCDISNNQHNSLCSLLRTHEEFKYFGYCKSDCRDSFVCAVTGETFSSECQANNANVLVDYFSTCHSTPERGHNETLCDVNCPRLAYPGCRTVVPLGACCPLCGTSIMVLLDKTSLQNNINAMDKSMISSGDIIKRFQNYISYKECQLFGHVLLDKSLLLLIIPTVSQMLVIEVCHEEAIKLSTLINNKSPRISSDPFLSHFVAANVINGNRDILSTKEYSTLPTTNNSFILLPCIILLFVLLMVNYI